MELKQKKNVNDLSKQKISEIKNQRRRKNLIERFKNALSLGSNYYHGDLYRFFDETFNKLEKNIISPDEAKTKISDLFHSNKSLQKQFLILANNSKSKLKVIGNKIRPFKRIRFGIIHLENQEYEPMHYHSGFISFQIVLKGKCILDECDKIEINQNNIIYKPFKREILNENDVMLNYSRYRNIHGFGAIDGSTYILSIGKYYGILGKFQFFKKKKFTNDRLYLDIKNSKKIDKKYFQSPLIKESDAYKKYSKI